MQLTLTLALLLWKSVGRGDDGRIAGVDAVIPGKASFSGDGTDDGAGEAGLGNSDGTAAEVEGMAGEAAEVEGMAGEAAEVEGMMGDLGMATSWAEGEEPPSRACKAKLI